MFSALAEHMSREEYINVWHEDAVYHMHQFGIPASITLAQGILESANGNSYLAVHGNNHFGIKCHGWEGPTIHKDDDKKNECFRKYLSPSQSYYDHAVFLAEGKRYDFLFDYKPTDYKSWAKGLKQAGYATNPRYPELLVKLIEDHKLYLYDREIQHHNQEKKVAQPIAAEEESKASSAHKVRLSKNHIKYVEVKKGDTFYSITEEFEMGLWQLYKYNDISKDDVLKTGDRMYLQPKRNKAKTGSHIVRKGETARSISQLHGIKLKKLIKRNKLDKKNPQVEVGQKIILR